MLDEQASSSLSVAATPNPMSARTQTLPAFPRFSRFSLGLSIKSNPSSPRPGHRGYEKRSSNDAEDWYIPYNGPYEKRKDPPQKLQPRDSWGDLISPDEYDAILGDRDLQNRYGKDWNDDGKDPAEYSPGTRRNRAISGVSHQTGSSAAVDPHRSSSATRRSTVSHFNANRPSYISMDAAGGVGESPLPPQRLAQSNQTVAHKGSFANLFSFGGNPRKSPSPHSRAAEKAPEKRLSTRTSSSPLLRKSTSSERKRNIRRRGKPSASGNYSASPVVTDEEDFFPSKRDDHHRHPFAPDRDVSSSGASSSQPSAVRRNLAVPPSINNPAPSPITRHPYAYVFPSDALNASQQDTSVPITRQDNPHIHQRILLTGPKHTPAGSGGPSNPSAPHSPRRLIKASRSQPNLRTSRTANDPQPSNPKPKQSKIKDRWFAVETWCDAILFPRPRFKLKEEGGPIPVPESPLAGIDRSDSSKKPPPGMQSRVLAHSRSMADIHNPPPDVAGPSNATARRRVATLPNKPALRPPKELATGHVRRSFAQDDLALPSPVPSLTRCVVRCFYPLFELN